MRDLTIVYKNGDTDVFKSIDEETIKMENGFLMFEEVVYLNGVHVVNLADVRRYALSL